MKAFKLIGILAMAITVSGCDLLFGHDVAGFSLSLSFQDASGKNRVEGIGYDSLSWKVEPELYTLRLFEDGKKQYPKGIRGEDFSAIKHLRYLKYPYDSPVSHYLCLHYGGTESKKIFTAFLICPYIFGDSTEHEITAYCKRKSFDYVCTRFTFDGEDIDITGQEHGDAFAAIVLD